MKSMLYLFISTNFKKKFLKKKILKEKKKGKKVGFIS
jgi:hypothetical protein